ncbi:MAG TPA: glycerol-3-phosphate cytidylyltransferase [Lachnospiraceae bacterium]|nr:glycerol-3-phosphate cytidylyltransferase [Lachnospiraceae bacterium]
MKKVITYGTFDLFHYGHSNLLKRAKTLGDYLIVGITTEDFDINRGKLNVQQSLMERIQQVKDSGLADEIILEEYEGQKIDDIQKYDIDVFVVGSDWEGSFDYLKEYCEVIYLDRTEGISSTELREEEQLIPLGIIGRGSMIDKFAEESRFVSGVYIKGICVPGEDAGEIKKLLDVVSAVYILAEPSMRGRYVRMALERGCHVICESPIALHRSETEALYRYAEEKGLVLFEALKTAYFRAFSRLILLIKGGAIGAVKSVDVTCTSMNPSNGWFYNKSVEGGSMTDWGSFVLLPILRIFGLDYKRCSFISCLDKKSGIDLFTQIQLVYPNGVANGKVGFGVKSEGSLVVSGTKAYIYVPSPWWKMEYFEIRYEDFNQNRRYFYKVDGEGIRYEIAEFLRLIRTGEKNFALEEQLSGAISELMEKYLYGEEDIEWI